MNTLGVRVYRAKGIPLKQVGAKETKSRVLFVHTVVIPSHKTKSVEAMLEGPLPKGTELVFEPDMTSMRACEVISSDSLAVKRSCLCTS